MSFVIQPSEQASVAINGSVVARSNWNEKNLCADDDIEILGAVSGG